MFRHEDFGGHLIWALQCYVSVDVEGPPESFYEAERGAAAVAPAGEVEQQQQQVQQQQQQVQQQQAQQQQQQQAQQNDVEEELPVVEFWGLPPLIPLLQYVNRLGFEICSVDSCQSEQGSLVTLI